MVSMEEEQRRKNRQLPERWQPFVKQYRARIQDTMDAKGRRKIHIHVIYKSLPPGERVPYAVLKEEEIEKEIRKWKRKEV